MDPTVPPTRSPGPADVTAIIPARDSARFLPDSIGSIRAQDPPPLEVVVVDDGSTDDSAAIAASFPGVRVVRQPPLGIAAARNTGIRAAATPLLAFLDADDLWLPGKLALQLAALAEEPGLDGVFTHIRNEFVDPGLRARYRAVEGDVPGLHVSTLLVRREAMLDAAAFDESLTRAEFVDWYARARDAGRRFRVLDGVYALRRIHGGNATLHGAGRDGEYLRMARARIAAARARGGSGSAGP